MKWNRDNLLEGDNWYIQFQQDWTEWLERMFTKRHSNWYNFRFFELSFEDEVCTANRELCFYILGLGFRAQWSTGGPAPALDIAKERMAEIVAHPDIAIDLKELLGEDDDKHHED